jgi:predicted CXXCH cytochrome family protein
MRRTPIHFLPLLAGLVLVALALAGAVTDAAFAAPAPGPRPEAGARNEACLVCHSKEGMIMPIGEDQVLVTIDSAQFDASVHGANAVACTDCHVDIDDFPHPDYAKESLREFNFSLYEATKSACQNCHAEEVGRAMNSVHEQTLAVGNHNAAMCADCHNPHYAESAAERAEVPDVCARCHSEIAAEYKNSVHGEALLSEANPDVPNCIVCHDAHDIVDPRTVEFRNNIPLLCAQCHTDASIMDKYGLSTNVLDSYVADFHGTTVTLFEQTSPDLPTNKPVCTDCHGAHNIAKTDDPQTGIALKANLLVQCQRCHPGATENFPDAWMSHYDASPQNFPLVYYVNLFYKFFIPVVIGSMLIFVITDIFRRAIERRKGAAH